MLKLIISKSRIVFFVLGIVSCQKNEERIPSVLEITNFELFKDWGIAYREPMIYLFTYNDTLRFMIKKEDDIYFVLNTKKKKLGMRPYTNLFEYEKTILKKELIDMVYKYQFDGISHISDSARSYFIMGQIQNKRTFVYFEKGKVSDGYDKKIFKSLDNWYIRITDKKKESTK